MMPIATVLEALQVLGAAHHRGCQWKYDGALMRVMPLEWWALEQPPNYTPWEAVTPDRWLAEIGAAGSGVRVYNGLDDKKSGLARYEKYPTKP